MTDRGRHPIDLAGDELPARLRQALRSFWMAYQPIVWAGEQTAFGYEALLRTDDPGLPDYPAVVAAAGQCGQIPALGRELRGRVAADAADAPPDATLFVNLHPLEFADPALTDPRAPLASIAPRVVLELTERAALGDVADVPARVAGLRQLGFRIALDDIAGGAAGLTSIPLFEPDFVKLDQVLVRGLESSPHRQRLVGAMAAMCADLGVTLIAEGVETEEERDVVVALGCQLLQGHLFARPGRAYPAVTCPPPLPPSRRALPPTHGDHHGTTAAARFGTVGRTGAALGSFGGAKLGAAVGTVVSPGMGTAIGGAVGAVAGALGATLATRSPRPPPPTTADSEPPSSSRS